MNRNYAAKLRRHRDWLLDPPVVGGHGEAEKVAQACIAGAQAIEILYEVLDILNEYYNPENEGKIDPESIIEKIDHATSKKRG